MNKSLESGPPLGINPVALGLYASPEVREAIELKVEGAIPKWLTGSLYRGAAATWDVGDYTAEHWFDGFSRNHRFEIADGSVSYRSRNSADELMDFVRETGRSPGPLFSADPCKIIFGAFEATYRDGSASKGQTSSGNVGVSYAPNFAGLTGNSTTEGAPFDVLVSTTDGNLLQQIDPVTLEPLELFTYEASNKLLANGGSSAAHPVLGEDGSVFNYVLDMKASPPTYRVFRISPRTGEAEILATITDAPPTYIHALFGSKKHLVLIVWQADLTKEGVSVMDSLGDWDPNRKTLFYVVDRVNGGLLRKYESPDTFFAFHEINTFEDEAGDILIDLPRLDDYSFLTAANMANLRANLGTPNASSKNDLAGAFTRYRLPFHPEPSNAGEVPMYKAEIDFSLPLAQSNIELPRINPSRAGQSYRFSYGIHVEKVGNFADSIIKIDADEKQWKVWNPETRHVPSEPIFVSRPGAVLEDDGVLLTVVLDAHVRQSSLVVIDATTMKELGRARMPIVMTYGFHGAWGQALQQKAKSLSRGHLARYADFNKPPQLFFGSEPSYIPVLGELSSQIEDQALLEDLIPRPRFSTLRNVVKMSYTI
ncbi:hypothetical protein LTR27_006718 [Elasticomyces elasticus]|nr:hypothetical protein LTR27_006718 [Elasticomyces elasticus]